MASVDVALMKLSEALENVMVICDMLVKNKKKISSYLKVSKINLPLMPKLDTATIQIVQQRENI